MTLFCEQDSLLSQVNSYVCKIYQNYLIRKNVQKCYVSLKTFLCFDCFQDIKKCQLCEINMKMVPTSIIDA